MSSLKDRVTGTVGDVRERRPVVDHAVRMQKHYGEVEASQQAGAITYFGFLSFFPIMGLSFFVVGIISRVYPDARDNLTEALDQILPGLIGDGSGQISVSTIESAASVVGPLSILLVLYSGLGWVTAVRNALEVVFEMPKRAQPNFVIGKLRDALSLASIGTILFLSVAVSGFVTAFSDLMLGWVGLDTELSWLVELAGRAIGFAANVLLFFAVFRLAGRPRTPTVSLWKGALLGAIAFEALKALSFLLLGSIEGRPAFQAFGIALILVVWINYFSRVILYAASWAHTAPRARQRREQKALEEAKMHELAEVQLREPVREPASRGGRAKTFAAGGATALALVAMMRRKKENP
ncbi:YihY/virulence factor BrkB family protein [Nocardioides sp. GCM10027113]|uniref:YihY/virulence factor BrkB family protein n=1 Tax=unclassified Nocardioides TaxID=2615069 RepID=UPI00361E3E6A